MSQDRNLEALQLIAKLLPSVERKEQMLDGMNELTKLIHEEMPDFLREDTPADSPEIYFQFQHEFEKFKDFIKFNSLANRNFVALGGGFSSGKSSFINAFLGRKILPAKIDPTTSVPTYIINGKEDTVSTSNIFGEKLQLDIASLMLITHDFTEEYDIVLGKMLQKIYIEVPEHLYQNLAFLDTPGYSKPESQDYSKNTDEKIARAQLNSSNYILWFISADGGTISKSDIHFLRSIRSDIPKMVIINKCDKKTQEDVAHITQHIKETLRHKDIKVEDVVPFSARKPQLYSVKPIEKFIQKWNAEKIDLTFTRNFKLLFMECGKYYDQQLYLDGKRRERISKAMLEVQSDNLFQGLDLLIHEIDANRGRFREKEKQLAELRMTFFTLIKAVGDQCGIPLPEPNEMDLIREKVPNPMDVLSNFKKLHGQDVTNYRSMVKNHLEH